MSFYDEYSKVNEEKIDENLKYHIAHVKPFIKSGIYIAISTLFFFRAIQEYNSIGDWNNAVLWNVAISVMFVLGVVQMFFRLWIYKGRIAKDEYIKMHGAKGVGEIVGMKSLGRCVRIRIGNKTFTKKIRRVQNERLFKPIEWYEVGEKYEVSYNPENMEDFVILDKISAENIE